MARTRTTRARASMLVAALATAVLAPPAASASGTAGPDGPAPGASQGHVPRAAFGPCGDEALDAAGAECATVPVPLDHRDPDGPTVDLAISRIRASDREHRRGALLVNPGGPGAPGLDYPLALRDTLGAAGERYDLIGFDPRFVGRSEPITCGPTRFSDTFRSDGVDRAGFDESAALATDYARRCGERNAEVLAFAGTPDMARDLDVIRAALGERRVSYYGVSWGAQLGAAYSELFPRRVDRMVLDSSTEGPEHDLFAETGPVAERAFDEFARWAAAHDADHHLGTTARRVRTTVEDLVATVARRPVVVINPAGGPAHRVDDHTLPLLILRWLNHAEDDPVLAAALADLRAGAETNTPVTPTPELAEQLALYDAQDPAIDQGLAVIWANLCDEPGWPEDPERSWHAIERTRRSQPLFGALANGVKPCVAWETDPAPAVEPRHDLPLLMVQAERDNNTPLASARRLHEQLTGSRLVTADVRAHGVYARGSEGRTPVPCIDEAVNEYLRTGRLPASDGRCR